MQEALSRKSFRQYPRHERFKGHEVVIIVGQEQPSPRDAERRAMAVWYVLAGERARRNVRNNDPGLIEPIAVQ